MECDVNGFLAELSALTVKYGVEVGGCGCCGSPFLMDIETSAELGDRIEFSNGTYRLPPA